MANPEHLSILEQGITHWNRWIRKNRYNTTPDLSEADLSNIDLSEADLRGVNLSYSDLRGANLSEADLERANLSNVDLKEANLIEADLSNADLRGTYLNKANLSYSDLRGTNLSGANLNKVCIEDCQINTETNLQNIKCDYIFVEYDRYFTFKFYKRYPQDRIFNEGEFEELLKNLKDVKESQKQKTIDLTVNQEINWQAFSESFEQLKVKNEEGENLHIEAIEDKEDGTFTVRIQAPPEIDQEEFKRNFEERYQAELKLVEFKYKQDLNIKNTEIDSHKRENKTLIKITELLAKQKPTNVDNKTTINYDNSQGNININSGGGQVNRIATNENNQSIQGNNNKVNSNQLRDNATQQANPTPEQQFSIAEVLGNSQNLIFSWQFITIAISSLLALFVWFHQTYLDTSENEQPKQTQPESQFQ